MIHSVIELYTEGDVKAIGKLGKISLRKFLSSGVPVLSNVVERHEGKIFWAQGK